jgi:hypothetical protein
LAACSSPTGVPVQMVRMCSVMTSTASSTRRGATGRCPRQRTASQGPGGIASDRGVRGDIGDDDRSSRDDRAIADGDTRHDDGFPADPYVVSDDGVAAAVDPGQKLRGLFEPSPAEDEERESRRAHHRVVCVRQEEFGIHGNGAELADNQLLRAGRVEHVPGLEESRIVRVVIVGEFSAVLCGSCPGEKAAWLSAQRLD